MKYHIKDILYMYYNEIEDCTILVDYRGNHYKEKGTCLSLLKRLCCHFGATLKLRKQCVKQMIKGRQKLPLLISEKYMILFFPTFSYESSDTIWLHYNKIEKIKIEHDYETLVQFCGQQQLSVPLHIRSMRKQMKRCKTIFQFLRDL